MKPQRRLMRRGLTAAALSSLVLLAACGVATTTRAHITDCP